MRAWVRWFGFLFVGALLASCGGVVTPIDEGASGDGGVVPGQFIVTLAQSELSTLSATQFELVVASVAGDHRATPGRPI